MKHGKVSLFMVLFMVMFAIVGLPDANCQAADDDNKKMEILKKIEGEWVMERSLMTVQNFRSFSLKIVVERQSRSLVISDKLDGFPVQKSEIPLDEIKWNGRNLCFFYFFSNDARASQIIVTPEGAISCPMKGVGGWGEVPTIIFKPAAADY